VELSEAAGRIGGAPWISLRKPRARVPALQALDARSFIGAAKMLHTDVRHYSALSTRPFDILDVFSLIVLACSPLFATIQLTVWD
jgi:hypothetical protein